MAGVEVWTLRLISLLSGLLSVGLVMVYCRRVSTRDEVGLLGGVLLALSSPAIFYSQQARSYALFGLLALWFWSAADAVGRHSANRKKWMELSVVMVLLVMTHYFGVFYILCAGIYLLVRQARPKVFFQRYALAALPAVLSLAAWIAYLIPAYQTRAGLAVNLGWIETPNAGALAHVIAQFIGLAEFPKATTVALAMLGLVGAWVLIKAVRNSSSPTYQDLPGRIGLLLVLAIVPPVLVYLLARPPFSLPIWGLRYVFPSVIFMVMGIALSVGYAGGASRRIVLAGAFLFISLQVAGSWVWTRGPVRLPYHRIAQKLEKEILSDGMAVYSTWEGIVNPVNFYLKDVPGVKLLAQADHSREVQMIVLYRPQISEEREQVDGYLRQGWVETSQAQYDAVAGLAVRQVQFYRRNDPIDADQD